MKNQKLDNAKVGAFVAAGIAFLIFTLYMIGKNRNMLGSSFTLKAIITNVNGLVPGNNVRFKGIDVGTVTAINVINDSSIIVSMQIDKKMKPFLRRNAIASVGTDGLMGSKLLNINSQPGQSEQVDNGDIIQSMKPVEPDEMLRTLNTTNNNIERITRNLYDITNKLNNSESLWNLLSDSSVINELKSGVSGFKRAGANTAEISVRAKSIITRFEQGGGIANQLFLDTTLARNLASSLSEIQTASKQASLVTKDLSLLMENLKKGEGSAGLLLTDSLMRTKLMNSATNVELGTSNFNQNMEALKHHFLFRGYFKRQAKANEKETEKEMEKAN